MVENVINGIKSIIEHEFSDTDVVREYVTFYRQLNVKINLKARLKDFIKVLFQNFKNRLFFLQSRTNISKWRHDS
jgi:outer membrane protein assembly factor BamD (BamD/ComL family)